MRYIEVDTDNIDEFHRKNKVKENIDIVFIKIDIRKENSIDKYLSFSKLQKEKGVLTIPLVIVNEPIIPSEFSILKKECNSIIIIQNEDEYLEILNGIKGMLISNNKEDISLELEDIQTVMEIKGLAFVSMSEYRGVASPEVTLKEAVQNLFSRDIKRDKVMGVLIHFTIHPTMSVAKVAKAMEYAFDILNDEASVIWATTTSDLVSLNYTKVTVMAVENFLSSANNFGYTKIDK